jgi:hypothetical protein
MTLERFVRFEWEIEEGAGFPHLQRSPSSNTRRFFNWWGLIEAAEREALKDVLARIGAMGLGYAVTGQMPLDNLTYKRWIENGFLGRAATGKLTLMPLRLMKNAISADINAGHTTFPGLDADEVRMVHETASARAPDLRKLIKPAFAERLGLAPSNQGGGDWDYLPKDGSQDLRVHIDFGGMTAQLRYWAACRDPDSGRALRRVNFEQMLGLQHAWDWITAEGAIDAVELLCDEIDFLRALPARLAALGL